MSGIPDWYWEMENDAARYRRLKKHIKLYNGVVLGVLPIQVEPCETVNEAIDQLPIPDEEMPWRQEPK